MKKLFWIFAVVVLLLFVVLFAIPFLWPWTSLNCWHDDIDITAGRYRYQRYLLYMKTSETIEETKLSKMYREFIGQPPAPQWRRVNTCSPGHRNSPHHAYHGALVAAKILVVGFNGGNFSNEAKKIVLTNFFNLLKTDDNDFRAKEYAVSIANLALSKSPEQDTPISAKDLPAVPEKE